MLDSSSSIFDLPLLGDVEFSVLGILLGEFWGSCCDESRVSEFGGTEL